MKFLIHIPDNNVLEKQNIDLSKHGATKLFDFKAPHDFSTRSVWEVVDYDIFDKIRIEANLFYYLVTNQMFQDFEKLKSE